MRRVSFKSALSAFVILIVLVQEAYAQTVQIGTGTDFPTSTLYSPVYRFSATSTTQGSRSNILFLQSELAGAGIPAGAIITAVEFNKINADNFLIPAIHSMYMGNTANTTLPTTTTWASILSTHTQVFTSNSFNLPGTAGWVTWNITPFVYTGGSLEIATETDMTAGGTGATGPFQWEYTSTVPTDLIVGAPSPTATTLNGTVSTYKHRPNIRITFIPPSPCTNPPNPGTVVSNLNPVCLGIEFNLSLTGYSIGTGQTYQWQISPDNTNWTDITGATTTSLTTSQSATNFYRCIVTCGVSVPSPSLEVITPPAVSGTFTINSALPTGSGNFQTFNDAYAYMSCGINGPVVFNVDPASGPYNEQLVLNEVPGASATNTITFNGNGRVLEFLSTNTNERAVIKLDGADHFIFDSLTINALATATTEYGFAVQLLNSADSNIVRKCSINVTDAQTSTNHIGISISGSATSSTTTGAECDDNLFELNTIAGGYYGITNVGSSTIANQRNKFVNNIIKDFYLYGIYTNGTFQTLIEGNDFSRPARSNLGTGTSAGIYFTGLSTSAMVNANRIHGLLDADPTSANNVYGIYFTGVDALAGLENMVTNNAIYDIKSEGLIYGIYNSSSDNVFYYHNTISLDHIASTTSEDTRAFYQTTTASGIEFRNNLITLRRGGTGDVHGLYFNTSASTIVSNNNDIFFPAAANKFFGYNGTNQATLADWQTATSQDANSLAVNPFYVNLSLNNLQPTSPTLNDSGVPVGITTDILGASRSATNPDIGAWEFDVGPCAAPPDPGNATASVSIPICPNELVTLGLINNSLGTGQTYQWQSAPAAGGPWTDLGTSQTAPSLLINPTSTLFYRCAVTCSGLTEFSTEVEVVVNALFPAGTYTINSAVATGGTNFQSFNDAYNALRCGIAGPIVFNVVPGSGPYNEQVIMEQVQGTSDVNTVTWNGNGEVVTFLSTNTNERAVFKLNGTDHFIFDSLTVEPQGTATSEYGFGFHLTNDADSNIIRNCTINLNTTSTSSNYAGIVSSAGLTATTTGTNASDYNEFDNNTITGGYYGITNVGSSTVAVGNNKITNNTIRDFYFYGIYLNGNFNTLVEKNDIARPNRLDVSTFYGVYMTSLSTSVQISKNRIHNPFDGEPTATSTFGGIYITGVDALAGLENVVSNNAIYNVNGNGIQYGMYNSSSDNTFYYHNTVDLSQPSAATTSTTYGFYQSTTASGIDLKDNIFSVTRGSNGTKYCLYFSTSTTTFTSENNGFYRAGANANIGYNGTAQATLANWRAATGQDMNSISGNPFYTDASIGNLEPRSVLYDDKGVPVGGITTDINDLARSVTTPDVGAWEFLVPPCTEPPVAGVALATPNTNICLGTPIDLELSGNSSGAGQSYQWQFATAMAGPYTDLGGTHLFPDTTILAAGTLWYRCVVTCGTQSTISDPVLVNMNPPFPAGVYTINNTIPTDYPGGTNFNSFVEAVAVMECGIDGPVTFNVAAGTYNEQVRMHAITGTSDMSRVTFQSANGDPTSVTLSYDATASAENYVLQLDSASYITWKNMTITALNTTNGRVVDFSNTASYDSLLNCSINAPSSTNTSTAVAGIYGSGLSGTGIIIKGNTITGGTAGIYLLGSSTTLPMVNNIIDSNSITGHYYYGVYRSNAQFSEVTRNTIPVMLPRNTTSYGIYLSNNDSAYQVNENRITIEGTTSTAYGMYLTGCAARPYNGSVSRNIIKATNGISGTLYGMYQTATQGNYTVNNVIDVATSATSGYGIYSTGGNGGKKFYNNTIRNSSTNSTSTSNIAAYFSHSASSEGLVNIRNNIFMHDAGGIPVNYVNVASIYTDFNMYYTSGGTIIRQSATNYATLQDWKDAQNWDYNSIVYTPAFVAGTDLEPDVANPDVWAMHGRGVQIDDNPSDINGNVRSTTLLDGVPDMGAYEFLPTVNPPALPSTPAAPAPGTTQVFMFGTDTVQKITWAPASVVPSNVEVRRYSGIIPPGLAAGQESMYFYVDVDYTGSDPTDFKMEQFYIDPWMRDIPSEPTVKMGRTDVTTNWFVSSNSVVETFENRITEENLSFLDKFTGMTDGVAPPPVTTIPLNTTDTSNRGRRFWVAYGHHYGFSTNGQDMVLYLSAEDSANVTVRVNGTNWVRNYAIPANTVRVSDLMPESGLVDARITDEGLFNTGISIESDVPIVAYAHIYQGANSGAGMLLPTGTYGYEYRSLNSNQYYPTGGAGSYSWFMVIADRDSTLVEITPSVDTKGGRPAGVPFQVYLMRGQVYNVMGTQPSAQGTDISGSVIKSIPNAEGKCYPIAVFSGSSRTALCNTTNGDNFIQQVFPNQAWGTKYLTFATASSLSNTTYYSNKWRVMVKDPATVVSRNGVVIDPATLVVPGNYYEFGITQGDGPSTASYIEADQPIMVAQYMLSSDGTGCSGLTAPGGDGDPEMIYISPIEQGIKRAVFFNTDESSINSNYINVIIPTGGLASLTIDGSNTFTDVFAHPGLAGYTCVRQNLGGAAAQHIIQSDSAFTAITYGLGSVESYGYNAGTLVKNLSAVPAFNNIYNTGNLSTYTCVGTPFRFRMQISVKPTQIIWGLSQVPELAPNMDVTQTNPVPTDSVFINGKKFYTYILTTPYTFATTGNYAVPITIFHPSIEGCSGSLDLTLPVEVIDAPVSDFSTTFSGCVGDAVQFMATTTTSNGTPTNQWTWDFGDTNTGAGQNPTHTYATAGTYNVMVTGIADDGCIGDTTKPVTVNPLPANATTQDTVYVCNGANATFTVVNPVSGATYDWYDAPTGGTLLGSGTSYTVNSVTGIVNIYLEVTESGCPSATRTRATANVLPTLSAPTVSVDSVSTNTIWFSWTPVANASGYEVSIDNGLSWQTPSSGPTGLTHAVTGLPLGTTVTLRARATGGCLPAESQPVSGQTVTDQVYIPNAFSPNNDGLNDVLRVYSNVIRDMRFTIFNQWGEKIFESTNQATGWDGTHRGKAQPSGVYIYVCDITLRTGERIQRKGSINLVR